MCVLLLQPLNRLFDACGRHDHNGGTRTRHPRCTTPVHKGVIGELAADMVLGGGHHATTVLGQRHQRAPFLER